MAQKFGALSFKESKPNQGSSLLGVKKQVGGISKQQQKPQVLSAAPSSKAGEYERRRLTLNR